MSISQDVFVIVLGIGILVLLTACRDMVRGQMNRLDQNVILHIKKRSSIHVLDTCRDVTEEPSYY